MWSYFAPTDMVWYRWRLNGAEGYVRKNGSEWRTVFLPIRFEDIQTIADGPVAADPPADAPISFIVAKGDRIALRPLFPERPFLIIASNDIRMLAGSEARFEIDLPVLFRLELVGGEIIGEAMPFILSNTWFGDKTGGTLCYSLPKTLDPECPGEIRSECSDVSAYRSLVHCSLRIRNAAKTAIDLKRVAVYSELLGIYEDGEGLRTDDIAIDGLSDGGLKTTVSHSGPKGRQLAAARVSHQELLVRRGVNFLRTITGI